MPKDNLPDFSGKIVVFYMRNASGAIQNGIVLESVSFTEHGDRLFVTGKIPPTDTERFEWDSNLPAALAWDDVIHYVIFDTREDYTDRMGKAEFSDY